MSGCVAAVPTPKQNRLVGMVNSNMVEKGKTEHRQRLRERFLAGDAELRSDEMLLELLLTFAIGRKDVMPLAQELIRVFGSLAQVLSASYDELCKVKGIGRSSIILFKVVDVIQSGTMSITTGTSPEKRAVDVTPQQSLESLPDEQPPDQSFFNTINKSPVELKTASVFDKQPVAEDGIFSASVVTEVPANLQGLSQSSKKQPAAQKRTRRKFQVSRSHLLEFNHFARILSFLYEKKGAKRINRDTLIENSGLPDGQVASLISIGASIGLIKPGSQILTPIGLLIAENDIFLEKQGTLEWCHYKGAGSYQNLIWFDVFNYLLREPSALTSEGWQAYFRGKLKGQYSDKTIRDHVPKEIRFVIDAYMERNLSRLELLQRTSDEQLYLRCYTQFTPLVLSAMIYDFCTAKETHLFQVGEMAVTPGSPAVVFGLDTASFRLQIEGLHDRGWLRYETTHNLDQIRLKPGFSALKFLTAYFAGSEPLRNDEIGIMK